MFQGSFVLHNNWLENSPYLIFTPGYLISVEKRSDSFTVYNQKVDPIFYEIFFKIVFQSYYSIVSYCEGDPYFFGLLKNSIV